MFNRYKFLTLILIAIISCAIYLLSHQNKSVTYNQQKKISISTNHHIINFNVELANTPQKQQYGLMYRKNMADDHGMLFIFDNVRFISMWMKNTFIPLDMIFINEHNEIVDIYENATPLSKKIITSKAKTNKVLEINAGLVQKYNIKIGNKVII